MKRIHKAAMLQYVIILIFIAIWETAPRLQWVNPFFIPPFSEVVKTGWKLTAAGTLPFHAVISIERACGGFAAAILLGIPLGVILGSWFERLKRVLEPVLEVLSQINPFILFHILLLFLGIGETVKIMIIAWTCIWPIVFCTVAGIRNIDPLLVKAARAFGINRWRLLTGVTIPAAGPAIFTGLRISAGYSLFMLIAAEMMGCASGLGWFILNSQENYKVPDIFAAALTIALLGLGLDALLHSLEKKWIVATDDGVSAGAHFPNILATRLKHRGIGP